MEYVIDTSERNIDWNAKGTNRIIQNIVNLISTFRYEVAYDRLMGLNPELPNMPVDQLVAEATSEIIELISTYEPRAEVQMVDFLGIDTDGNMQFKVVIDI